MVCDVASKHWSLNYHGLFWKVFLQVLLMFLYHWTITMKLVLSKRWSLCVIYILALNNELLNYFLLNQYINFLTNPLWFKGFYLTQLAAQSLLSILSTVLYNKMVTVKYQTILILKYSLMTVLGCCLIKRLTHCLLYSLSVTHSCTTIHFFSKLVVVNDFWMEIESKPT